jgi:hypothetical protein
MQSFDQYANALAEAVSAALAKNEDVGFGRSDTGASWTRGDRCITALRIGNTQVHFLKQHNGDMVESVGELDDLVDPHVDKFAAVIVEFLQADEEGLD